jgi:hypothetical protein
MKQDEIENSSQDEEKMTADEQNPFTQGDDEEDTLHLGDSRKPKLTLKHLNKLRKMRELRRFEKLQQNDFHELMYGIPEEEQSPLG